MTEPSDREPCSAQYLGTRLRLAPTYRVDLAGLRKRAAMRPFHHAVPATPPAGLPAILDPAVRLEHWPTSQLEYADLMAAFGHTIAERDRLRVEVARLNAEVARLAAPTHMEIS